MVTGGKVKTNKINLGAGLLAGYNDCFSCLTEKNKTKHKSITKAVSISINYTAYIFSSDYSMKKIHLVKDYSHSGFIKDTSC